MQPNKKQKCYIMWPTYGKGITFNIRLERFLEHKNLFIFAHPNSIFWKCGVFFFSAQFEWQSKTAFCDNMP